MDEQDLVNAEFQEHRMMMVDDALMNYNPRDLSILVILIQITTVDPTLLTKGCGISESDILYQEHSVDTLSLKLIFILYQLLKGESAASRSSLRSISVSASLHPETPH